jgi:Ca2+-binding EF-hand superfamily protein
MKRITFAFTVLFVAGIALCAAVAQSPGDGRGPEGQGRPDGFRPPMHPLEEALDADGDHQLSAKEIENAVAALKTLDKNEDGKLGEDELRPRFGGRPGGADGGGRGFGRPDGAGRPDGRGPGPDGPPQDRAGERPASSGDMLSRVLSLDKNEDGKLTKDELPEGMHGMIERGDANGDGALDKEELAKIAAGFRGRGQQRRPDGDRPEGRGGFNGPPSAEMIVNNAMRFDADGDEKLNREELTKFAQEMSRWRGEGNSQERDGRGPEGDDRPGGRPQRPSGE